MKLYFTRHGQVLPKEFVGTVDFPKGDIPLSELGKKQAVCAGRELARLGFHGKIYSSPYSRTLTTADLIAERCGVEFFMNEKLREKIFVEKDALEFRGLTEAQIKVRFANAAKDAGLVYPWWTTQVDDIGDIADRVGTFWDSVIDGEDEEVFAVGHGATQVGCIAYFNKRFSLGLPEEVHELEEFVIPRFSNCNLNCIELDENRNLVSARLFMTDHLSDEMLTSNSEQVKRPEEITILQKF